MRFILLLIPALLLAACGSQSSSGSSNATPTPTPGGVVEHIVPASPKPGSTPVPTRNPHASPVVLPTVKVSPPKTPTPFPARAYKSVLYGTVRVGKTHKPLSGVDIIVQNGQRTARTDASGHYSLAFPSKALVNVQASKKGYACGLAIGVLKVKQRYRLNFTCAVNTPSHPSPPSAPSVFGQTP